MNLLARKLFMVTAFAVGGFCLATRPCLPEDLGASKGATVTVLAAAKHCFDALVEVSGVLIAKDETMVRPERPGLKVAEIFVDAGETVTAGQALARLTPPEGGAITIQAPVAGLVSHSSAVIGAIASAKGEALFGIIPRSEFELVGMVPAQNLSRLAVDQSATVKIVGAEEVEGKVRSLAATVEPNTQLGQVFITLSSTRRLLVNSSGRATIKTGESCGVAVPLTAILYGSAGTVVQVVRRDRVETKRVDLGLMASGRVEIRDGIAEGDVVVARAGALLREGDPVRPVSADGK
jgi:multidrug efflux pump subunit AcrA (membrane-fusion protein)